MDKEIFKPVIKKFLGHDVRTIVDGYKEYIVLKDMFMVLGRVADNGSWTKSKDKMKRFLINIGKIEDVQSFHVLVKQGKIKTTQEVDCLLIDTVPIVLTQFEPTARKGEQALKEWIEFMKWVDNLLRENEAYKVILKDKEEQKKISKTINDNTKCKMVVINTQVSRLMAELIGVYPHIKKLNKDELKIYQPQVTIDLIEVRQEALKVMEQQLLVTEDYKSAYDFTLKYMKKIYNL